jgi:hypothetical protein
VRVTKIFNDLLAWFFSSILCVYKSFIYQVALAQNQQLPSPKNNITKGLIRTWLKIMKTNKESMVTLDQRA